MSNLYRKQNLADEHKDISEEGNHSLPCPFAAVDNGVIDCWLLPSSLRISDEINNQNFPLLLSFVGFPLLPREIFRPLQSHPSPLSIFTMDFGATQNELFEGDPDDRSHNGALTRPGDVVAKMIQAISELPKYYAMSELLRGSLQSQIKPEVRDRF